MTPHQRHPLKAHRLLAAAVLGLAGCTSGGATSTPPASTPPAAATEPVHCADATNTCAGAIDAGTHTSTHFTPIFSYTVPPGWVNIIDGVADFTLTRTADPSDDFTGPNTVGLYRDRWPASQNCEATPEPNVGHTATALTDWLTHLPGVHATGAHPVTVGGLSGTVVDVTVAGDWQRSCPWADGQPIVQTTIGGDPGQFGHVRHFITTGVTTRYYILDRGAGSNIVVEIQDIPDGIGFDDYAALATPIVESIRFNS